MKQGWEYKKLGEVCEIYQPKTLSSEMLVENGKYRVYGANGVIGYYNDYNHEQSEILLTCRGATCGTINISEPFSWINGNAMVIHRKSEELSFDFLKYLMLSLDYSLIITGAAQSQITRQKISPTNISYPPLPVQQSIVAELDEINHLLSLKRKQLETYDKLAQSLFYEMFGDPVTNEKGWEVKKLGEVCEVSSFKRVLVQDVLENGPVPFIRGTELTAICKDNKREYKMYITMEHYEKVKAISGVPKLGDLLIPSINSEGYVWVVDTEEPMYYKDGRVLWVHVDTNSISSIALQRIMTNLLKDNYSRITNGAVFAELNLSILRDFPVILPPLPLQQQFAQRIEAIESQKANVKAAIEKLETLLASRMQYWFE